MYILNELPVLVPWLDWNLVSHIDSTLAKWSAGTVLRTLALSINFSFQYMHQWHQDKWAAGSVLRLEPLHHSSTVAYQIYTNTTDIWMSYRYSFQTRTIASVIHINLQAVQHSGSPYTHTHTYTQGPWHSANFLSSHSSVHSLGIPSSLVPLNDWQVQPHLWELWWSVTVWCHCSLA